MLVKRDVKWHEWANHRRVEDARIRTYVIVALDVKNQPPSRAVIEAKRPFFFARQPFIPQVGDNLNNQKKNC